MIRSAAFCTTLLFGLGLFGLGAVGCGGGLSPWSRGASTTDVPELTVSLVKKNHDSVRITVVPVAGASDYRAYRLHDGISFETGSGGTQRVLGADIYCAGHQQVNDARPSSPTVVPFVEVDDIREQSRIVVEALDKPCPFAGVRGPQHMDVEMLNTEVPDGDRMSFSVYSEEEIRARYGSLIVNGHGAGKTLGQPAEADDPQVLARTTIDVAPLGNTQNPTTTFFSFARDESPTFLGEEVGNDRVYPRGQLFASEDWLFYAYANAYAAFFVDHGLLHMVLADWVQDVFGHVFAIPRQTVQLDHATYLHVQFEVPSNASQRRYWWFFLCGAEQPGQTLTEDRYLQAPITQTPFFYQADGRNPSVAGWNCLQLFPRDGSPYPMDPDATRPQSDVRVMINVAGADERDSVVNVSPDQYHNGFIQPGWFRQQDATGDLVAPILDDQLYVRQRTAYDLYIKRDRVIMYVNDQLRLCNDFPDVPLTMNEGILGFGSVLYHSAAERLDFTRDYNDRSGQSYYLENTPYIDARQWDNIGFQSTVEAPSDFAAETCYVHH